MPKNYIGTSFEILELLEKSRFAAVLTLTDDALVSADAAVADLARQMARLSVQAGPLPRHAIIYVSAPKETKEPEMTVLVALQAWLDEHLPTVENTILICSEETVGTGATSAVRILLADEKYQYSTGVSASTQLFVQDEISARLQELWQKAEYQDWTDLDWVKHPPFYPTSLMTNGVLVLGINPSLNIDHLELPHYKADWKIGSDYFGRLTRFKQDVEAVYQRFQATNTAESEISGFEALPWSHLDVLYVRETNQARFREEMGREGVAAFLWEQTQLTKLLLEKARPRLILVANTFARELLGKNVNSETKEGTWMGLTFTEQPDLHTGTYHCTSLPGSPPIFFTGSLAGSNPRDKAADERLTWQIARCLLK